ncbi:MAG: VIT domain-containing protein, partial [Planctomycetota bacterium]
TDGTDPFTWGDAPERPKPGPADAGEAEPAAVRGSAARPRRKPALADGKPSPRDEARRLAKSGDFERAVAEMRELEKHVGPGEGARRLKKIEDLERFAGRDEGKTRIATRRPSRPVPWQAALATDELWVIERPVIADGGRRPDADLPTQGELRAKVKDGRGVEREIPLPLEHTDVKGEVAAFVATVNVTQKYHNPYGEKIEAVYVFPLPQNSAVTEFVMTIGKRRIRGIIREREEAQRIYAEARRRGHVASLLTQERPNIFTQRVANIEPGKKIDITITYFNTLKYSRGEYEFVFPMVVGPRYNPPGWKDGVGAVGRGARGRSGQATEVQYLKPGERSGHDIAIALEIDAGVEVEKVTSPTHVIETQKRGSSRLRVALGRLDAIPNKDFVLRYKVAGKRLKTAMLVNRGEKESHFALVLQPPADLADLPRMPREMVFVLDCSGSMGGWPMSKAKEAMRRCLRKLGPDDTFQVIRFSNNASSFGPNPVPATSANIRRALSYVDNLRGSGGTRMIEGIRTSLDFPHDPKRLRIVSFMTDGYIGNESQILAAIHEKLGEARIFSFGVGKSVNRYLVESMAKMGRGAVAYVGMGEGAGEKVDLFYERCSRPALTDMQIDWGNMEVDSVYPRRLPDLFVGRPVVITGRFDGRGRNTIRVSGRAGMEDTSFEIKVDLDDPASRHRGITKVWARKKLAELAAIGTHSASEELTDEMVALSLEYSVQCRHTAFVAVDSSRVTAGTSGVTVAVPVPVPEGVRYDTTVSE